MANPYFQFKQFTIYHDRCAMKVTTDACLFGAWVAKEVKRPRESIGSNESNESLINGEWLMENDETVDRSEMIDYGQRTTANDQRLLDIGTGTGLLSLMVAQKNPGVQIDAVEIDAAAAIQAAENVAASPYATSIAVHHSDIADWKKGPYDIVISNPPFYEKEIPSSKQGKNVAHHGEGLQLETLFRIIKEKLTATGSFYLLLPYKRRHDIERQLQQTGLYMEKQLIVHPAEENLPFRLLLKGSKQSTVMQTETLSIYDSTRAYTPAFVSLLKDYYLYL